MGVKRTWRGLVGVFDLAQGAGSKSGLASEDGKLTGALFVGIPK